MFSLKDVFFYVLLAMVNKDDYCGDQRMGQHQVYHMKIKETSREIVDISTTCQ